MILSSTVPPSSATTATSSASVYRTTPGKLPPSARLVPAAFAFFHRSSSIASSVSYISLRSPARSFMCSCVLSSTSVNSMLGNEALEAQLGTTSANHEQENYHRKFSDAKSEEELISAIKGEAESGRLPSDLAYRLEQLFYSYRNAVLSSGSSKASEIVLSNMSVFLERIYLDVQDTFYFSSYHKALKEPFNYYTFGVEYIRPLVDFGNSFVGNINFFNEVEEKLKQGHNIILISNHQTEADPAIISLMLESTHPHIAENLIFIAGDRVVTDPLCKPFSMGRNLICVYSKKHMHDAPELVEMKKRANIASMKEMAKLFREGSKIVWIAPSGGRDRPDPITGEWHPARFDVSSVENIRRLAEHSDAPAHVYPLALLCHEILPPPPQVEKEIGERRVLSYSGVGLSIAPEVRFNEIAAKLEKSQAKVEFSNVIYTSVTEHYNALKSAMIGREPELSTSTIFLSQPWI